MKPDIETARLEMIEASKKGAKIFNRLCEEEESVAQGVMAIAFAYAIASKCSPSPIPLSGLHELIDLAYDIVHSIVNEPFKGAEKYGMQ